MAIIKKQIITEGGYTFNRITSKKDYYGLGYDETKTVRLFTPDKEPLQGGTVTDSMLDGFGADTFEELMSEAKRLNLKFPE